jgi:hypothetical protein
MQIKFGPTRGTTASGAESLLYVLNSEHINAWFTEVYPEDVRNMLLSEHGLTASTASRCPNPLHHNLSFNHGKRPLIYKSVLSCTLEQSCEGKTMWPVREPCTDFSKSVAPLHGPPSVLKKGNTWSLTAQCWAPQQESTQEARRSDVVVVVCCV